MASQFNETETTHLLVQIDPSFTIKLHFILVFELPLTLVYG